MSAGLGQVCSLPGLGLRRGAGEALSRERGPFKSFQCPRLASACCVTLCRDWPDFSTLI